VPSIIFFLDDHFNSQYNNDVQFASIFGVLTIITIIISSSGLLGLGIFSVSQRIKEIGIRRVLGRRSAEAIPLSWWKIVVSRVSPPLDENCPGSITANVDVYDGAWIRAKMNDPRGL
jgi:hypothetical protein